MQMFDFLTLNDIHFILARRVLLVFSIAYLEIERLEHIANGTD